MFINEQRPKQASNLIMMTPTHLTPPKIGTETAESENGSYVSFCVVGPPFTILIPPFTLAHLTPPSPISEPMITMPTDVTLLLL